MIIRLYMYIKHKPVCCSTITIFWQQSAISNVLIKRYLYVPVEAVCCQNMVIVLLIMVMY